MGSSGTVVLPIRSFSAVLMECAELPADDVVGAAMARTASSL